MNGWRAEGHRFALATVSRTWGSSPRPVGAVMAVRDDGAVTGSVSGGCVESAVQQAALEALEDGRVRRLDFGAISDEAAWEVGLSCGGQIGVWIDPRPVERPAWNQVADLLRDDAVGVLATRFEPFGQWLWTPSLSWNGPSEALAPVRRAGASGQSEEIAIEGRDYFLHVFSRRQRLVIVGAVHIAIPLTRIARDLGFETLIVDPRPALATADRFPEADRIIQHWPERAFADLSLDKETYAVVLTHDPKIDDAALAILLRSSAAYIGALGSRVTQEKRRAALREQGFGEDELNRIHGPVGLAIGARSPSEIALSILAEIVQVRHSRG